MVTNKVAAPRARRAALKPKKAAAGRAKAPARPTPSVEEVRFRAYAIYRQRDGYGYGDELSDWLQAETELLA